MSINHNETNTGAVPDKMTGYTDDERALARNIQSGHEASKKKLGHLGYAGLGLAGIAAAVGGYFAVAGGEGEGDKRAETNTTQVEKLSPYDQLNKDMGFEAEVLEVNEDTTSDEIAGLLALRITPIVNDSADSPAKYIDERINLIATPNGREDVGEYIQNAADYLNLARFNIEKNSSETGMKPEDIEAGLMHTLNDSEVLPDGRIHQIITTEYRGTDLTTGGPIFLVNNAEQWDVILTPAVIELSDGQSIETLKVDSIEKIDVN